MSIKWEDSRTEICSLKLKNVQAEEMHLLGMSGEGYKECEQCCKETRVPSDIRFAPTWQRRQEDKRRDGWVENETGKFKKGRVENLTSAGLPRKHHTASLYWDA